MPLMSPQRPKHRRTWRDTVRYLLLQRDTPESIALGVALGTFIALTPTLGVQLILALTLAWLLDANRLAALPPLAITNALTAGPIYGFECWIGAQLMPHARSEELLHRWHQLRELIARREFHAYLDHWRDLARTGWDLWLAMWIGSVVVGSIMALAAYWLTLGVVRSHRRRRTGRRRRTIATVVRP